MQDPGLQSISQAIAMALHSGDIRRAKKQKSRTNVNRDSISR